MNLKELRAERGIMAKDMVSVVRSIYPKYDKTIHSKVERGREYGIDLRADAMTALGSAFSFEPNLPVKKKRAYAHLLTRRISCRLTDSDYDLLQLRLRSDGYKTVQAWLTNQVSGYIERRAPGGEA